MQTWLVSFENVEPEEMEHGMRKEELPLEKP
jgi:hypothetical protein